MELFFHFYLLPLCNVHRLVLLAGVQCFNHTFYLYLITKQKWVHLTLLSNSCLQDTQKPSLCVFVCLVGGCPTIQYAHTTLEMISFSSYELHALIEIVDFGGYNCMICISTTAHNPSHTHNDTFTEKGDVTQGSSQEHMYLLKHIFTQLGLLCWDQHTHARTHKIK